LRSIRKQ